MKLASFKKLSRRDRRALALLGGVAALILLLFGVVFPFLDAREEVQTRVEGQRRLLERYVHMIEDRQVYREQLSRVEQVLSGYQSQLLDASEVSTAKNRLEEVVRALAAENQLTVTRSNPMREEKLGEQYVKITLQISLQGDMRELTNFLYALATHEKFLVVENFILNRFRSRKQVRVQPRMNVSAFIRLS